MTKSPAVKLKDGSMIWREPTRIEVTSNGMFGAPADSTRQFIDGPTEYWREFPDGRWVDVSEDEVLQLLESEGGTS